MAWRYGIIGLILYIGLFLYPAFILLRNHRSTIAKIALLFLALLLTTALTNNPFSDRTVVIFFAIILGFSFETDHFLNNKSILPTNESN
jgi:O-antigen ligase